MTNLEKIEEMMKNDSTLQEKLAAETKRLTDSGEKDLRKISAEAVKATFGTDLTDEELDQVTNAAAKAATKLDLDELDSVAGGASRSDYVFTVVEKTVECAGVGGLVGTFIVPAVGTVIGTVAGAAIGATIGTAKAAIDYVNNEM